MDAKFCYGCMQPKRQSPVCELCGYDERQRNEMNQLPVGTVLQGQYVVGRVLGQGGFGITYIGWDRLLEIPVAIKEYFPIGIVHRDLRQGAEVTCLGRDRELFEKHREKFLQEARTLAQLTMVPEIVQVRNFFVMNNTAYIVMEYLQGTTLKNLAKNLGRPMTLGEALDVMAPVLLGLQKVHERQLIHRDISPDNIMLTQEGGIKLIDFGTAKNMDDGMRSRTTESVLKPGFAPLEQYNSKGNLGTWTDVYAACATFHYLLTGKLPPDAPTRIEEGEELPLLDQVPTMTPGVRKTLKEGLSIRAADRIQTVEQLRRRLYEKEKPVAAKPEKKPEEKPEKKPEPKPEPKPQTTQAPDHGETKAAAAESGKGGRKRKSLVGAAVFAVAAALVIALGFGGGKPQALPAAPERPGSASGHAQKEEPRAVTLKVWTSMDDQNGSDSWLYTVIGQFEEAHPEYRVTWDIGVCAEGDVAGVVKNDPAAAADVFIFANDQLGTLVEAGGLTRVEGAAMAQILEDTAPSVINGVTYVDGGIYGFPISPNTWFMWYNKSVYTEEDVKSLNTMLEKGVVSFPMNNSWYTASFLLGAGGSLYGPVGNDAAAGVDFANGDCVLAAEFMVSMAKHPNFVNDEYSMAVYGMQQGSIHAMFSGSWDEALLRDALGDDLGCAVLPAFTIENRTYQMLSFNGSKAIGVNPHAEDPEAAMKLAAFLASPDSQLLRYRLSGATPVAGVCSRNPAIQADQRVAVELAQASGFSVVQPTIAEMAGYWDPMKNFGEGILNGTITKEIVSRELYGLMDRINGT